MLIETEINHKALHRRDDSSLMLQMQQYYIKL